MSAWVFFHLWFLCAWEICAFTGLYIRSSNTFLVIMGCEEHSRKKHFLKLLKEFKQVHQSICRIYALEKCHFKSCVCQKPIRVYTVVGFPSLNLRCLQRRWPGVWDQTRADQGISSQSLIMISEWQMLKTKTEIGICHWMVVQGYIHPVLLLPWSTTVIKCVYHSSASDFLFTAFE